MPPAVPMPQGQATPPRQPVWSPPSANLAPWARATACPYCINMFVDSAKGEDLDEKIAVMDIAEIMAEAI